MKREGVLGLIPARGGSKGIPRKNIKLLAGRPLIAYTIDAALEATTLDRVVVSTDDAEIAECALRCGADVPFLRPIQYATDDATATSVAKHACAWLEEREGFRASAVAWLVPTCPLREARLIDQAVTAMQGAPPETDSVVTVHAALGHPYFLCTLLNDGRVQEWLPMDRKPQNRQEIPAVYQISQAVYVSRGSYLQRIGGTEPMVNLSAAIGLVIERSDGVDIDTLDDFVYAEHLMLRRKQPPGTGGGTASGR
jgi:CMP-N-acetylneuraminic acid synthetase